MSRRMSTEAALLALVLGGCGGPAKSPGAGGAPGAHDSGTAAASPGDSGDGDGGDGDDIGAPASPVAFALPLTAPDRYRLVVGVDHDPVVQDPADPLARTVCLDRLGRAFPHCYDEHDGSDFILHGGFSAMDEGTAEIVAGAAGTVTLARDGHYDRCHADASGAVDCDGHDMVANAVILEHEGADGARYRSKYWHMKQGSVAVAEGEVVAAGTRLGLVGSSGNSSMPHLHFQLERALPPAAGDTGAETVWEVIDPYAGPLSQELSWWCSQSDDPDGLPGGC